PPEEYLERNRNEDPVEYLTEACDIYQLGVVLFRLLTGAFPFEGKAQYEVLAKICEAPAPSPSSRLGKRLDPRLDAITLKCLEKTPKDRFVCMSEMAAALAAVLTQPPKGSSMPPSRLPLSSLRFSFVGLGATAPPNLAGKDRLFLDAGNDLRAGVIDHHHL